MTIQQRIDSLSAEIRSYPTPIARCDLHLPALIEERSRLMALLRDMQKPAGCLPENVWANEGGYAA
jgi:hypothetical protein